MRGACLGLIIEHARRRSYPSFTFPRAVMIAPAISYFQLRAVHRAFSCLEAILKHLPAIEQLRAPRVCRELNLAVCSSPTILTHTFDRPARDWPLTHMGGNIRGLCICRPTRFLT